MSTILSKHGVVPLFAPDSFSIADTGNGRVISTKELIAFRPETDVGYQINGTGPVIKIKANLPEGVSPGTDSVIFDADVNLHLMSR